MRALARFVVLGAICGALDGAAGQTTNASTGALPFATTPAPRVVASSAGRATAAGWASVVGCNFCSWCQWCKK